MIPACDKLHLFLTVVIISAFTSFGQLPPSITKFGTDFARDMAVYNGEFAATTNRLPQKYIRDLEDLSVKFQKDGDLDGLLAVKKEIKRFKELDRSELDPFEPVPDMTDEDVVQTPADLRNLQEQYRRGFAAAKNDYKNKVRERGEKLLAEIEAEKIELTKADKISEAVAVRDATAKISTMLKSGDYQGLIESFGIDSAAIKVAPRKSGTVASPAAAKKSWNAWKYRSVYPFARELPRYLDPDVPNELNAYFDQIKGVGRVSGTSRTSAKQVGDVLCSWFGKAFIWDVTDVNTLEVDIRIKAKTLSSGADRGPHIEVAVLANGTRVKAISVPVQCSDDRVRIVRKKDNEFEFSWPFGKKVKPFTVPAGARINVLVGIALHNTSETCDVSFQLEDPAK